MKRVLVVHQYRPPGSFQDRQRGPMYAPLFEEAGFQPSFIGRHPMPMLSGARSRLQVLLAESLLIKALNRIRDRILTPINDRRVLSKARKADVIVLVKTDSPSLVDRLRRRTKARLVYDLADSIWRDGAGKTRPDLLAMLSKPHALTIDNGFALGFARTLGPEVHLWPSAAYVEEFDARRAMSRRDRDGRLVIGWIGSHTTVPNLYLVVEAIEDIARKYPAVEVRLLGIPPGHEILRRFEHARVSTRSTYSTREMIDEVLAMDIGLYPMFDLEDSGMHGTTKGVIYMAGGAVVVASPVHDVATLVKDGQNGLLAEGRRQWATALDRLISDAALRSHLRETALVTARSRGSLAACFAAMRPALGPDG